MAGLLDSGPLARGAGAGRLRNRLVDRGHRRHLRRRARLPRLRLRRLRRAGRRTGALDRLALEPDRHPGLPGRWPAERHGEQLRRHRGDPAARSGGQLLVSFELNSLFDAGQHRRGARDRHRQQPRDRRRHVGRPVAFPDVPVPQSRSRAAAGTSCTCSRPAIPRPTRSRARSRCRPARTGESRRSRPSRARAP